MAKMAGLIGEARRWIEYVPITFEVADDLAYWWAEIPGKVKASATALTGPTTPAGARVQLLNPPGSETGPGQICTWGKSTDYQVNAGSSNGIGPGSPASTFRLTGQAPAETKEGKLRRRFSRVKQFKIEISG